MSAAEALPWLFLVLSAGTFLVGAYLLVSGRQAKMAGAETNSVKFLGVEITSSTSGTMLILLSVVATVLIINLGLDDQDKASADIDPDPGPTTSSAPTDPTTTKDPDPTDPPTTDNTNPSGLERDDLISVHDLENATEDYGFTDWQDIDPEHRPVLDCLDQPMPDLSGFLSKAVKDNFEGDAESGYPADAMTSATRFSSEAAAEGVFRQVKTWLETCPGGVAGATPLDPGQAGPLEEDGDLAWRNFFDSSDPTQCAGSCVWVDSQGVALVDDAILLVSVRWYTEDDPSTLTGPMPDLLPVVVDQLG